MPTYIVRDPETGKRFRVRPQEEADQILPDPHPEAQAIRQLAQLARSVSPDTAKRYLEQQGFESVDTPEGGLAVRRPGEQQYRQLDPSGYRGIGEVFQDIGDIMPEIHGGIAMGLGGAGGFVVGGPKGAIAGSAAMGGIAAGQRAAVARVLGAPVTFKEGLKSVGIETAIGGATEGAFQAVRPIIGAIAPQLSRAGKAMQVPLEREAQETIIRKGAKLTEPTRLERKAAIADVKATRVGVGEAQERFQREMADELAKADSELAAILERGGVIPGSLKATITQTTKTTTKESAERLSHLELDPILPNPEWVTAAALKKFPRLGAGMRRVFGPNVVAIDASGAKAESWSIKFRGKYIPEFLSKLSPQQRTAKGEEWVRVAAAILQAEPKLQAFEGGVAREIAEAASGRITKENARIVSETLKTVIRGKKTAPYISEAVGRFKTARGRAAKLDAELARQELELGIAGARERLKSLGRGHYMGGLGRVARMLIGGGMGQAMGGYPGAAIGSALGYQALPFLERRVLAYGGKALGGIGRGLEVFANRFMRDRSGLELRKLITTASSRASLSASLRGKIEEALDALANQGYAAYQSLVAQLVGDPEFQQLAGA